MIASNAHVFTRMMSRTPLPNYDVTRFGKLSTKQFYA
jgi:hypothetical protein